MYNSGARRTSPQKSSAREMTKARKSATKSRQRKERINPKDLVTTKQEDYLKEDAPIIGQSFACVSFVSAEDIIAKKDAFFFERYLNEVVNTRVANFVDAIRQTPDSASKFADTFQDSLSNLPLDFSTFVSTNRSRLEESYAAENPLQITISGFKIRGSYADLDSAKRRAESLQAAEKGVDVYVAQVGAWCPFNPSAENVGDIVYDETELNTLMKMKRDADDARDKAYATSLPQRVMQTRNDEYDNALPSVAEEDSEAEADTNEATDDD